jgi:hypothetical protein
MVYIYKWNITKMRCKLLMSIVEIYTLSWWLLQCLVMLSVCWGDEKTYKRDNLQRNGIYNHQVIPNQLQVVSFYRSKCRRCGSSMALNGICLNWKTILWRSYDDQTMCITTMMVRSKGINLFVMNGYEWIIYIYVYFCSFYYLCIPFLSHFLFHLYIYTYVCICIFDWYVPESKLDYIPTIIEESRKMDIPIARIPMARDGWPYQIHLMLQAFMYSLCIPLTS